MQIRQRLPRAGQTQCACFLSPHCWRDLFGFGVPGGRWVAVVLGVMIVLLALTVFNRARKGLAELSK